MTDFHEPFEEEDLLPAENSLLQYMKDINSYPRLTEEEERELAIRCAQGDPEAIRKMVVSNLRLVVKIARGFANRGVPMLDLIQEGSIGLITATKNYDYTQNVPFSAYARIPIVQRIDSYLSDNDSLIYVPYDALQQMKRILRVRNELLQKNGEAPDLEQLAEALDMKPGQISKVLERLPQICSLDVTVGESDELKNLIEDLHTPQPQEILVCSELTRIIQKLLSMLENENQRQVLSLYYGFDGERLSLSEIAERLGFSKQRAQQLKCDALDALRKKGAEFGLEDFYLD